MHTLLQAGPLYSVDYWRTLLNLHDLIETQKSQLDSDVPLDSMSQFVSTNFISCATYARFYQDLQVEGSENVADLN